MILAPAQAELCQIHVDGQLDEAIEVPQCLGRHLWAALSTTEPHVAAQTSPFLAEVPGGVNLASFGLHVRA